MAAGFPQERERESERFISLTKAEACAAAAGLIKMICDPNNLSSGPIKNTQIKHAHVNTHHFDSTFKDK